MTLKQLLLKCYASPLTETADTRGAMYTKKQLFITPAQIQEIHHKAAFGGFSSTVGVMLLHVAMQEPLNDDLVHHLKRSITAGNIRLVLDTIALWLRPHTYVKFTGRLRAEVVPAQSAFRWLFSHNQQDPFNRALVHMAISHKVPMSDTDRIRFRMVLARFEIACQQLGFRPVLQRSISAVKPPYLVSMNGS